MRDSLLLNTHTAVHKDTAHNKKSGTNRSLFDGRMGKTRKNNRKGNAAAKASTRYTTKQSKPKSHHGKGNVSSHRAAEVEAWWSIEI